MKQLCPLAMGDVGLVISGDGIECGKGMRSGLALVIVSLEQVPPSPYQYLEPLEALQRWNKKQFLDVNP